MAPRWLRLGAKKVAITAAAAAKKEQAKVDEDSDEEDKPKGKKSKLEAKAPTKGQNFIGTLKHDGVLHEYGFDPTRMQAWMRRRPDGDKRWAKEVTCQLFENSNETDGYLWARWPSGAEATQTKNNHLKTIIRKTRNTTH